MKGEIQDFKMLEEKRTVQILYYFGFVSALTLITMMLINCREEQYSVVLVTFIFLIGLIISLTHLHFKKKKEFSAQVYGLVTIALTVYLISTGGVEGNGILWLFIFPPLIYFVQGIRKGSVTLGIIFIIVLTYFYAPEMPLREYEFGSKLKLRFLIALLTESLISFFAEYSRNALLKKMSELSDRLKHLSMTDELTGILNRRGGIESLKYIKNASVRNHSPFSVLMLDIDRFKSINDTYGHDAGDKILCLIVDRIRNSVRAQDMFSRWGGEEFFVILPQTNSNGLNLLAEKLRTAIDEPPFNVDNAIIHVTASCGGSVYIENEDIDELIKRADESLYLSKQSGRNRVTISEGSA